MTARVWSHPKHKYPAAIGALFNLLAAMFITLGMTGCTFRDSHDESKKCASVLDKAVFCDDKHCFLDGTEDDKAAGWQGIVGILGIVAISINGLSTAIQIFVFWPLAMTKGVFNVILRACALLEIISGFIKFITAFILLNAQIAINESFMKYMPNAMEMRILPAGLIHFSVIFSFVGGMLLIVATDPSTRGEPPYLSIIDELEKEQLRMQEMTRKVSVYRPSSKPGLPKTPLGSSTSV